MSSSQQIKVIISLSDKTNRTIQMPLNEFSGHLQIESVVYKFADATLLPVMQLECLPKSTLEWRDEFNKKGMKSFLIGDEGGIQQIEIKGFVFVRSEPIPGVPLFVKLREGT